MCIIRSFNMNTSVKRKGCEQGACTINTVEFQN